MTVPGTRRATPVTSSRTWEVMITRRRWNGYGTGTSYAPDVSDSPHASEPSAWSPPVGSHVPYSTCGTRSNPTG